jgi:dihydroorotate dehydrogenase electron transfer subunit
MFQVRALITEKRILAPGYYYFNVLAPEIAAVARPGQFVQIRVAAPESNDPLLSRPISIHRIDAANGSISFIFKVVGKGTELLAGKGSGELLEILGSLGQGFEIPEAAVEIALIAGGVGMPPLFCLNQFWRGVASSKKFTLFYGGRSRSDLLELSLWAELGTKVFPATEDGSFGRMGFITESFLKEFRKTKYDFLVACGPLPMLQAVQKIALSENIPGQVSLEAHMACGVGACLGCVCRTKEGFRRVCVDGPVFSVNEVLLS